ncbi:hypothetical protein RclHR1_01770003 [Rhizophagus clarus]|uniref:BED-type domain-containing protein n=1 Tax=Rhizophagus clarus TaxID=94130 RepID=A0A2Z6QM50_9GLOM|nr:hypothetical protein RclHR1_01770003 [Rhizophagus clarus]
MAEEQEQKDYNTFPYDSFIEEQIFIDYENEDYEEENKDETMAEMAEAGTKITDETETEASGTRSAKELKHARVWEHFERKTIEKEDGETEAFILCHICEGHFSTNNSTKTLERHLKSKHLNIYKDLGQDETSSSKPWTTEVQNEKHKLFINWIITDQQPFTIVENQNFKKFIASIQPKYKIPS